MSPFAHVSLQPHSKNPHKLLRPGGLLAWLLLVALSIPLSHAADEEAEEGAENSPFENNIRYLELKPTFVANFGPIESRKLMYVKTDITLRMNGAAAEEAAMYHLPALRHEVVMLLSRQSEEAMATGAGRDEVRNKALAVLNEVLQAEEGEASVEEVMFTNLLLQR